MLRGMLATGTGVARSSSAGRLFDGVAALTGLRRRSGFEGQAAMDMEFAAMEVEDEGVYPFALAERPVDWAPMIEAIATDLGSSVPAAHIARRFHNTLTEMIVAVAKREGLARVCLTGGCFQNRLLAERTIDRLLEDGLLSLIHISEPTRPY